MVYAESLSVSQMGCKSTWDMPLRESDFGGLYEGMHGRAGPQAEFARRTGADERMQKGLPERQGDMREKAAIGHGNHGASQAVADADARLRPHREGDFRFLEEDGDRIPRRQVPRCAIRFEDEGGNAGAGDIHGHQGDFPICFQIDNRSEKAIHGPPGRIPPAKLTILRDGPAAFATLVRMSSLGDPKRRGPGLAGLQAWFGSAIATPLPESYADNPLTVSSPGLAAEADARLRGPGGFGGFARLGVYNEQYWFRLVSVMQADYTCAIHLMGLHEFNAWAVRYLAAHPPASPFLADLDSGFPAFLQAEYAGPSREAVLQAVAYERALSKAFDAPSGLTLAASGIPAAEVALRRLAAAPHLSLVHIDWDFSEYRARCAADESLEREMGPPSPGPADLVIYRDADLQVLKAPMERTAWSLLREFPGTLGEVLARCEETLDASGRGDLEANLGAWFRDWVTLGWLCLAEGEGSGHPSVGERA